MRRAGLALALCLAGPLAAQDLPALHDVTGVAADDVLNVRSGAGAGHARIGTLAPDARGIEVTEIDGAWGRINTGEAAGWVSLSYMARQSGQWQDGLPDPRQCFGTEPFWSLALAGDDIVFEPMGAETQSGAITLRVRAAGRPDRYAFAGEVGADRAILVMGRGACGDGMSDRLYGLSADLLIGDTLYSGCCSVQPR